MSERMRIPPKQSEGKSTHVGDLTSTSVELHSFKSRMRMSRASSERESTHSEPKESIHSQLMRILSISDGATINTHRFSTLGARVSLLLLQLPAELKQEQHQATSNRPTDEQENHHEAQYNEMDDYEEISDVIHNVLPRLKNLAIHPNTHDSLASGPEHSIAHINPSLSKLHADLDSNVYIFLTTLLSWDCFRAVHGVLDYLGSKKCPDFPPLDSAMMDLDAECDRRQIEAWLQGIITNGLSSETVSTLHAVRMMYSSPPVSISVFGLYPPSLSSQAASHTSLLPPLLVDAEITLPFDPMSPQPIQGTVSFMFNGERVCFRTRDQEQHTSESGNSEGNMGSQPTPQSQSVLHGQPSSFSLLSSQIPAPINPRVGSSLYPLTFLLLKNHPRFLRIHGVIQRSDSISVVLERVEKTLGQQIYQIQGRFALTTELSLVYMMEIIEGLQVLHQACLLPPRFVLNPTNVYLTAKNEIKLDPYAVLISPSFKERPIKERIIRFPAAISLARLMIELVTRNPITTPLHQALRESPKIVFQIFRELADPKHSGILPLSIIRDRVTETLKNIASFPDTMQDAPEHIEFEPPHRELPTPSTAINDPHKQKPTPLPTEERKAELPQTSPVVKATSKASSSAPSDYRNYMQSHFPELAIGMSSASTSTTGAPRIWVASSGMDQIIKVYDPSRPMEAWVLEGHKGYVTGLALGPGANGTGITAISSSDDRTIGVWDVNAATRTQTLTGHSDTVNFVSHIGGGNPASCINGWNLMSGGEDKAIRLWDTNNPSKGAILTGHPSAVYAGCRLDETRVASGDSLYMWSFGPKVRLWDVASEKMVSSFRGHSGMIYGICSVPPVVSSSPCLASCSGDFGGSDNTIRLWDIRSEKNAAVLRGHQSNVRSVCALPGVPVLASCGWDRTVRVWDLRNYKQILVMRGHSDFVNSLTAFVVANRPYVVSGGGDHTVRVWDGFTGRAVHVVDNHTQSVLCVAVHVEIQ